MDQNAVAVENERKITQQHTKQCTVAIAAVGHLLARIKVAKYPTAKSAAQSLKANMLTLRAWYEHRLGMPLSKEDLIAFSAVDFRSMKSRASVLYTVASNPKKKDARSEALHKDINVAIDTAFEIHNWQVKKFNVILEAKVEGGGGDG